MSARVRGLLVKGYESGTSRACGRNLEGLEGRAWTAEMQMQIRGMCHCMVADGGCDAVARGCPVQCTSHEESTGLGQSGGQQGRQVPGTWKSTRGSVAELQQGGTEGPRRTVRRWSS